MIYLDNAATSWPKPETVISAIERYLRTRAGSPGRSGHALSIGAARTVFEARAAVARLVGLDDPLAVTFARNATEALNLALFGVLAPGDHVITSEMEHNSVLRPLRELERRGVAVTRLACAQDGTLDPDDVARAVVPSTRLIVLGHASNVVGTLAPLADVGRIARDHDLLFCVDAAQTAGAVPIDVQALRIDLLAFSGHKSLLGPQGTGGLCFGRRARGRVRPLLFGGTGSASDSDAHPDFLPDAYEAGTLNGVGLAGLAAGIGEVEARGLAAVRAHEEALTERLIRGLGETPGVRVYGPGRADRQAAIVSFTVDDLLCSEVAAELEERAGVCCRSGLHCAPLAHRRLGTFPTGTVRLSPGPFTREDEIDVTIAALRDVVASGRLEVPL